MPTLRVITQDCAGCANDTIRVDVYEEAEMVMENGRMGFTKALVECVTDVCECGHRTDVDAVEAEVSRDLMSAVRGR